MKLLLITVMIMCCLINTSCTRSKTIGIIGGADGPTSIIIGSEKGESQKKPIRMIKVDGKLYYDSGRINDITAKCGTLDGELKKVGKEYEIPQNNNECNFDGALGYQNATSITKEVPIDGEWVIFKQFYDPELDMSIYKYCFYLKGRTPKAVKDSEIVVLTDDINYNFEKHSQKMFSSMYIADANATTFRVYGDTDKWGITLVPRNVTEKGLTIECEQFGKESDGELQTGDWYSIDVLDNDEWKAVDVISREENIAWNAIAYLIPKNEITQFDVNWEWLYGELPNGFYRLNKEIMNFRKSGDYDKEIYHVYFTVEK